MEEEKIITKFPLKPLCRNRIAWYMGTSPPESNVYMYDIVKHLLADDKVNRFNKNSESYAQLISQINKRDAIYKHILEIKGLLEKAKGESGKRPYAEILKSELMKLTPIDTFIIELFYKLVEGTDLRDLNIPKEWVISVRKNQLPLNLSDERDVDMMR